MKPKFTLLAFFCLVVSGLFAQTWPEKYSKVKIPITSEAVRKFAFDRLNIDHFTYEGKSMVVVINSEELSRLRQSGYAFEIVIDDVVNYTTALNKAAEHNNNNGTNRAAFTEACKTVNNIIPTPTAFGQGGSLRLGAGSGPGYFTYAEMSTAMTNLANTYPTLVSKFTIGNSAAGTAIYGVKISDNVTTDENEPEVLYTALQHAREAISGTSLIFFMQYLAENYATDADVKALIDNRELFIIPCTNPDGYSYNYDGVNNPSSGGGLWRKNRRNTGGGASNIGVDLNRNYSIDWGNCSGASTSCGSNVKTDDTYYGPSAFSEPETQALRDFVYQRHFVNAIDQHCYGPYYSLPYGRPSLHPVLSHVDSSYYTRIPALMGTYNGYRAGNSPETVNYEVAGGIKDWLLMGDIGVGTGPKGKCFGMTGEAGGGDFWAPVAQISQLCKEMCFQDLQLAVAAGDYYDIDDLKDIAVTSATGKFSFTMRRIGIGSSTATISLIPIENIASVGSSVSTTIGTYYNTYTDSISYTLSSPITSPYRIRYAWKVDAGGIITYDTVVKFFNPTVLINEDCEGTLSNWTSTSNVTDKWAITTLAAYGGTHSITESPAGNYTTSTTRTLKYNSTLDLSNATAAYLSFWAKYRAENFRDKMQVQVSTNGSTWTPICGTHTVAEPNTTNGGSLNSLPALTGIQDQWTRQLYDLSGYLGNATVSLQFVFTSDNDASAFAFELDDGFYLDNIKVVKSIPATSATTDYFRSKTTGTWSTASTWESSPVSDFSTIVVSPATLAPTSASSGVNIRNGHTVTVNSNLTMDQTYVHPGGTLAVTGATLTISGNGLTIQSDATGDGRIGTSTGTISGNVTVERYIPLPAAGTGRRYRLLAPGVTTSTSINANWQEGQSNTAIGINVNNVPGYGTQITGTGGSANGFDKTQTNQPSLYLGVNGSSIGYTPITSTLSNTLNAKTGYFLFIRGDRSSNITLPSATGMPTSATTLRATGTVLTGTQTSFTNALAGGAGTMNLITNPYPSPIDWSAIYSDAGTTNIGTSYSLWDAEIGTRGAFVTVSNTGVKSNPSSAASINIQSGQAFFVTASGAATPTVTIKETHKSSVIDHGIYRITTPSMPTFTTRLFFYDSSGYRQPADGVTAVYDNSYSAAVDNDDAPEINNWDENIAIDRNNNHLAIEARPTILTRDTIPLFMNHMRQMNYELQFDASDFNNPLLVPTLIDNYAGIRTPLNINGTAVVPFTVTSNAASSATDRFTVVFGPASPMPIDVMTIKAYEKTAGSGQHGIQVDWTAKTETNMDHYEVERSSDGVHFSVLNNTAAVGNSTVPVNYGWFDAYPVAGDNFYRIHGFSATSEQKYTLIVKVNIAAKNSDIRIYPNPISGKTVSVMIENGIVGAYKVRLINNNGQTITTNTINYTGGSLAQQMEVGDIASGSYKMEVINPDNKKTKSTVIIAH